MRSTVALGLLWAVLLGRAAADPGAPGPQTPLAIPAIPGAPLGDPNGVVGNCWLAARVFRSFASGPVDYCRGHLHYSPGELDCYQVTEQVCSVFLPSTREWIETRRPVGPSVFPCPERPEPPVCPRLTLQ